MVDLHSHIIPNVDDGSGSVEETFNIIKEAYEAGFTDIVCSSHYIENYYEATSEERQIWINEIQKILDEKNINIKLHIGAEVYVTNNITDMIISKKIDTINNSRYLLIELPMSSKIKYLEDILFKLASLNIVPIIAHPERYKYIQENFDYAIHLCEQGALLQANFGSFIGIYGKKEQKTAIKLLENGLLHFVSSDCHKENTLYMVIDEAVKVIKKHSSKDKLIELVETNPERVIQNKEIY